MTTSTPAFRYGMAVAAAWDRVPPAADPPAGMAGPPRRPPVIETNPATNLLLQGRLDHEPRRRGIPLIKALLAAGLTAACGQDCVQDGFYPFGAADQLQVALILCHAAQLSTPPEIDAALRAIGAAAARLMGVSGYGVDPGCAADLIVLDAGTMHEALRLQAARRWVIKGGAVVAQTQTTSTLIRTGFPHHQG